MRTFKNEYAFGVVVVYPTDKMATNSNQEIKNPMEWLEKHERDTEPKRKELEDFLKCVENNPMRLTALAKVIAVDGYIYDPDLLKPIHKDKIRDTLHNIVERIISGEMKVNGEKGHWNNGCFGSRWYDYQDPDLAHCRVAFYSKKFSKNWEHDKPFVIKAILEKTD